MSAIVSMCESLQASINKLADINKALEKIEEHTQIYLRGDGTIEVFNGKTEKDLKIKPLTAAKELFDLHSGKIAARKNSTPQKDLMKYENKILKKVEEIKR